MWLADLNETICLDFAHCALSLLVFVIPLKRSKCGSFLTMLDMTWCSFEIESPVGTNELILIGTKSRID